MVLSCLGLHWTNDLPGSMIQVCDLSVNFSGPLCNKFIRILIAKLNKFFNIMRKLYWNKCLIIVLYVLFLYVVRSTKIKYIYERLHVVKIISTGNASKAISWSSS